MTLLRHLCARFTLATLAAAAGLCGIHVVVNFVDNVKTISGPGWPLLVSTLYACEAAKALALFAPAALAFGGSLAMRGLMAKGEWTALQSLGHRPGRLAMAALAVSTGFALLLSLAEDTVIVPARQTAARIAAVHFGRVGELKPYGAESHWLKLGDGRVLRVGGSSGDAFQQVSILTLDASERVRRRVDAARLEPATDGRWRLVDYVQRDFDGDQYAEQSGAERLEPFGRELADFRVRTGSPRLLPLRELPERIDLRRKLGLPTRSWEVALHERLTYPYLGVPAALLAMTRTRRRKLAPSLTTSLVDGLVVLAALWIMTGLIRSLAETGQVPPMTAGWLPLCVMGAVSAFATTRS